MPLGKVDIQPLFAVPYFRADMSSILKPKHVNFIQSLKMVPNQTNLISENLYIFNEPELKALSEGVQQALDAYATQVMGITQKLYVTQSWALINEPGAGMHPHSHQNSVISGSLYYTDLPEPAAKMMFDRDTAYRQLKLLPNSDRHTLYNTPINTITPNSFEILLFPSELNHQVEINNSKVPRYSVAFNTFIEGMIGDHRDVSALHVGR